MKNKILYFSYPLIIIGIIMIILGLRWMIVDEPWLLDKVANEERLAMSFEELFTPAINVTLPNYLKQIYRFFGLWVIVIGLFIFLLSQPKVLLENKIKNILLFVVGFMIASGTLLAYLWIPSSPFIYLAWVLISLYSISIFNYK